MERLYLQHARLRAKQPDVSFLLLDLEPTSRIGAAKTQGPQSHKACCSKAMQIGRIHFGLATFRFVKLYTDKEWDPKKFDLLKSPGKSF